MKLLVPILLSVFIFSQRVFAQHNCSNPVALVICPDTLLTGQTNLGMLDDGPPICNSPGEDLVYKITVNNGAQKLFISIVNASNPMKLILEENVCSSVCNSVSIPAGNTHLNLTVTPAVDYFLWVDAGVTVNYDIAFGADTGAVFVNIPNTQGNLQFDSSSCSTPVFQPAKPFFQVEYNNVYQTHPMTLSPLFVPGTMCVKVFFKNTTGVEGIKRFTFDFNPVGFASIATVDSIPGFYNTGYWRSSNTGAFFTWEFDDAAGTGKGDFTGTPNTCLAYEFCFTVTPLSNNPLLTDVGVLIYSDGFGAGFSGMVSMGCCPSPAPNCMGNGGGGSPGGSGQAFGFGFADPGDPLPVELVNLEAEVIAEKVELRWTTATEVNNNYFSVQRSPDGITWEQAAIVQGAGTSTMAINYSWTDRKPLWGTSYYRLKQTDYDGMSSLSQVVKVFVKEFFTAEFFPLPADQILIIRVSDPGALDIMLYDIYGIPVTVLIEKRSQELWVNTDPLPAGLYVVRVMHGDLEVVKRKVLVVHNK